MSLAWNSFGEAALRGAPTPRMDARCTMNTRAAALLALGFTTVAVAQQPGSQPAPTPPHAGASEQRPATRQERASAQRVPLFIEADKNKDGALSRQEASVVPGIDFAAADT